MELCHCKEANEFLLSGEALLLHLMPSAPYTNEERLTIPFYIRLLASRFTETSVSSWPHGSRLCC